MSTNINMIRIAAKIKELFQGQIDLSDIKKDEPENKHFETRSLAALALMMKSGIDVPSSCMHITDGYHDMGIDAIYLDEAQKQLFLVQSKWRDNGQGSVSQEEMHTFVEGIRRIINYDIEGANEKIHAKKADIDVALETFGYQVHAVYIHTGKTKLTEYALRPLNDLLSTTNDEVDSLIVFDEILYQDIYVYLAQGQETDEITLNDVILKNWGKIDSPYTSYYGTVSAAAIGVWYREHGNRLFAKNIRFYKGNTDVNEGIKRVLLQEPENFYYYNNGIKLLCRSIHRKVKDSTTNETGLFMLEGVSLVNGAQTAGSIGSVFAENPEQVSKANVMIQIIDLSQASGETATQITKLSNTQNRIENRDFASLDPTQEKIRQELSFSNYTYLYKSGDKITDPDHQLTFDEAIVALACVHDDLSYSTLAKRNVGALSDDITKPPYKALINTGTNSFALLNSVMVIRYLERVLQTKKEKLTGRERLVAVHGNRFIAYCVLQQLKKEDDFSASVVPSDELQRRTLSTIEQLIVAVTTAMNDLYSDSYPANIFKNVTKCKAILERMNSV